MSGLATAAAVGVTLAAIGRLAATDPKRRRAFALAPFDGRRHAATLVALALGPGVVLLGGGFGAGFLIWLGATTVAGWAIAAASPQRAARATAWLSAATGGARRALHAVLERMPAIDPAKRTPLRRVEPDQPASAGDRVAAARIAALEQRIAFLEAALAVAYGSDTRASVDAGVERIADAQTLRGRRTGNA